MASISAQEWELLSFFEVEPELSEPSEVWEFNDAHYQIELGGLCLSVAIAPFHRDVRIVLESHDHRVYEFAAQGVKDLQYQNEDKCELLLVVIDDNQRLRLQVKPRILIEHNAKYE